MLLGEFLRRISEENIHALVETTKEKKLLGTVCSKNLPSGIDAENCCGTAPEILSLLRLLIYVFERIVGRNVLQKHV